MPSDPHRVLPDVTGLNVHERQDLRRFLIEEDDRNIFRNPEFPLSQHLQKFVPGVGSGGKDGGEVGIAVEVIGKDGFPCGIVGSKTGAEKAFRHRQSVCAQRRQISFEPLLYRRGPERRSADKADLPVTVLQQMSDGGFGVMPVKTRYIIGGGVREITVHEDEGVPFADQPENGGVPGLMVGGIEEKSGRSEPAILFEGIPFPSTVIFRQKDLKQIAVFAQDLVGGVYDRGHEIAVQVRNEETNRLTKRCPAAPAGGLGAQVTAAAADFFNPLFPFEEIECAADGDTAALKAFRKFLLGGKSARSLRGQIIEQSEQIPVQLRVFRKRYGVLFHGLIVP